jgi:hypothetical protein
MSSVVSVVVGFHPVSVCLIQRVNQLAVSRFRVSFVSPSLQEFSGLTAIVVPQLCARS